MCVCVCVRVWDNDDDDTPPGSLPSKVAMRAAGSTRAALFTTVWSEVVSATVCHAKGSTTATITASMANTTPVAIQKLRRAAAPSPRPRWYPTRTAMTMLNKA
jgi:hypothetical protein